MTAVNTQPQTGTIKIHERDLRGKTNLGWLDSKHTYSFSGFQDPERMGFRYLRVVNDDIVAPGGGFQEHGHENMEIISYVLEGSLAHKDSLGNGSAIMPGEVQRMSAGTGIRHSEFNNSDEEKVHFYQIWILPEAQNTEPGYEQKKFEDAELKDGFKLVGDRHGTDGAVTIHQDVRMLIAKLGDGQSASYEFEQGRGGFLQVARGHVTLNGETLKEGDGAEITDVAQIDLSAQTDAELILFDMG